MDDFSYIEERLSTAETELHISKEVPDRQEKIVDTKDIVLYTQGNRYKGSDIKCRG